MAKTVVELMALHRHYLSEAYGLLDEAQARCDHTSHSSARRRINDEYDSYAYYQTFFTCDVCGLRWQSEAYGENR